MTYKYNKDGNVIRTDDGTVIPLSLSNRDYREFLTWVELGNIPEPFAEPEPGPDFEGFQLAALSTPEFKELVSTAAVTELVAATSIGWLFNEVGKGQDPTKLISAMGLIIQAAAPSNEVLNNFIAIAEFYRIPEELITPLLRQWVI